MLLVLRKFTNYQPDNRENLTAAPVLPPIVEPLLIGHHIHVTATRRSFGIIPMHTEEAVFLNNSRNDQHLNNY